MIDNESTKDDQMKFLYEDSVVISNYVQKSIEMWYWFEDVKSHLFLYLDLNPNMSKYVHLLFSICYIRTLRDILYLKWNNIGIKYKIIIKTWWFDLLKRKECSKIKFLCWRFGFELTQIENEILLKSSNKNRIKFFKINYFP
jgi:hypothetical protein